MESHGLTVEPLRGRRAPAPARFCRPRVFPRAPVAGATFNRDNEVHAVRPGRALMSADGGRRLRPARADDVPRLVALARRSWRSAFAGVAPAAWVEHRERSSLEAEWYARDWPAMLVLENGGELLGVVQVARDEINGLWVEPRHQGRGIGTQLLAAGEQRIAAAGHATAWLVCNALDERALAFYRRRGYRETTRTAFVHACGAELVDVRLERPLGPAPDVQLRATVEDDLPALFAHQADPVASAMAAFAPRGREQFFAHWRPVLADPANETRTVLAGGDIAGYVCCFPIEGRPCVGYWIDRAHWGRGIASRALAMLTAAVRTRPLHAYVVVHNVASIRVLQKCGFREIARARGADGVDELVLRLDA